MCGSVICYLLFCTLGLSPFASSCACRFAWSFLLHACLTQASRWVFRFCVFSVRSLVLSSAYVALARFALPFCSGAFILRASASPSCWVFVPFSPGVLPFLAGLAIFGSLPGLCSSPLWLSFPSLRGSVAVRPGYNGYGPGIWWRLRDISL